MLQSLNSITVDESYISTIRKELTELAAQIQKCETDIDNAKLNVVKTADDERMQSYWMEMQSHWMEMQSYWMGKEKDLRMMLMKKQDDIREKEKGSKQKFPGIFVFFFIRFFF